MRRANFAAHLTLLAGILSPRLALAQGEDAVPLRAGTLRFSIGGTWRHATERYGLANPVRPGQPEGTRELLGIDYSSDSLGTTQLAFLDPFQTQIRSITGLGSYALNLGRSKLTLDASVRHQPITIEWAPTSRLVIGVAVPIVRARMSSYLVGPDTGSGAAAVATRGNVGFNAEYLVNGAQDPFRLQADAALAALATQAASGPVALRAQAQATLNALQPLLCGMSTLATASGSDAASPCFSSAAAQYSVLLPVVGSEAADSITARYGRGQTSYAALQAQYTLAGVTLPSLTAAYTLPAAALDSLGLRQFFSDPNGPMAGDSLTEVVRTGIGDIDVGAWYQVANGARWRSQLALNVRLPTGTVDDVNNFIDIGTGDHQTDVEIATRNDIVLDQHLWVHVGGRVGIQLSDQLDRRVSPWYLPLAPFTSTAPLTRDLGDYYQIDVAPNLQLDDAFGVGIGWHYFHQGATTYEYVNPADGTRIGLSADVLGQATSVSRMLVGAGVTFSTLARYAQRRARLPYRVTWSYQTTMWGRGGQATKDGVMTLRIQAYFNNR